MSLVLWDRLSFCLRLLLDFVSDLSFRILPSPYRYSRSPLLRSRPFKGTTSSAAVKKEEAEKLLTLSATKLAEKIRTKEVRACKVMKNQPQITSYSLASSQVSLTSGMDSHFHDIIFFY